jgi:NAD(P)-dependent dehydrogenase (short-subunit alcohol dehydrogenase family)
VTPTKTYLVTGGNTGIGYFVAEQLAATGATVLIGSRTRTKAEAAMTAIRAHVPDAHLGHVPLDLADLDSLKATADEIDELDAVVCNAGVMLDDPERRTTAAGHELMFATNHLGHFALIALLLPKLTPTGRVVTTGSFVAKSAHLDLTDPHSTNDYRPKDAYARSKLAQMLFGLELDRRLRNAGSEVISVVNHPGGALDSLTPARPPAWSKGRGNIAAGLVLQGKDAGAWPAVRAVLDPDVQGGQVWGPRLFGLRGRPRAEAVRGTLSDTGLAAELWSASEELTGRTWKQLA